MLPSTETDGKNRYAVNLFICTKHSSWFVGYHKVTKIISEYRPCMLVPYSDIKVMKIANVNKFLTICVLSKLKKPVWYEYIDHPF
jgi:hypothetical protein